MSDTKTKPKGASAKADDATLPAVAAAGAVANLDNIDYGEHSGAGMEGATQESFAIPFLRVLQSNSPQVEEGDAHVEGAKAGMFFDSVTGRMWDGKEGVLIVPCAYRRVFLHWGPRSGEGAGFKGELSADEVDKLIESGKLKEFENKLMFPLADGSLNPKRCAHVADTRNHYIMVMGDDGANMNCLMSLASTQIKKSKLLMSMLAAKRVQNKSGAMVCPPTFAQVIRATTVREENDDGSWYGLKFTFEKMVNTPAAYADAKAFYDMVRAGQVKANYEEGAAPAAAPRTSMDEDQAF